MKADAALLPSNNSPRIKFPFSCILRVLAHGESNESFCVLDQIFSVNGNGSQMTLIMIPILMIEVQFDEQ
jgi:hypothetical protein